MSYYVIIRGPAASGKSTIAKRLAKELSAYYIIVSDIIN
jgi:cytidylate kinase